MRAVAWVVALSLCGCPDAHDTPLPDAGRDAAVPDAAVDARVCGPDDGVFMTYENCLGCGSPCDAVRPFCCIGTCCAWECGAIPNDCAPKEPSLPDAGPSRDAGCIDEGFSHDHCLGCGISCGFSRPFCCQGTCCEEECGTVGNTCAVAP